MPRVELGGGPQLDVYQPGRQYLSLSGSEPREPSQHVPSVGAEGPGPPQPG